MSKSFIKNNKGSSLVEILVVMALVVLIISFAIGVANAYMTFSHKNTNTIKAGYLLEEGIEAVKIMRDEGWDLYIDTLALDTEYYLTLQNNQWVATTSQVMIDDRFDRTFILDSVARDGNDDIAEDNWLADDPNTKKVTVDVSWRDDVSKATTTRSISTYITNLFNN